jgi:ammonia channel protein AmtB
MSFPPVMQSSILREVVTVAWAVVGYGLASGGNGPFVGDLRFARLDNARSAPRADYAPTIPQRTFIVYVRVDTRGVRGADEIQRYI